MDKYNRPSKIINEGIFRTGLDIYELYEHAAPGVANSNHEIDFVKNGNIKLAKETGNTDSKTDSV